MTVTMTDEIADLLDRWDRTVPPLVEAAADAYDEAERTGEWRGTDELRFDRDEVMALMGEEAIELLRRIKEEQQA